MRRMAMAWMVFLFLVGLAPAGAEDETLQGFTLASSATEREWEVKFRALPSPDNQREYMRRPWYRHMIYAPGVYSGYGVKTLPGIREAIEERFWAEADSEIVRVVNVLNGENLLIISAAAELEQAAR